MEIRPAATLALTRDTNHGLEVLLLQRTWDAVFLPGYYVFPGGAVDDSDADCGPWLDGHDDLSASDALGLDNGGVNYMVAAIRECFEEAGLLLALTADGQELAGDHPALAQAPDALARGEISLAQLCEQHQLILPLDRLAYLSHWVTPPGPPRRFDTRFFVAAAPAGQTPAHDGVETIDHVWLTPAQALDDHRNGRRLFGSPTLRTLRQLADYPDTRSLLAATHARPAEPDSREPWPARGDGQTQLIESGMAAYAEVRKLDPDRQGKARCVITPGEPVTLGPGVHRITAPNPGVMTGPGTNTYVLGETGDYTVIDPGPDDDRHLDRLLAFTGGAIRQVVVTHTHRDHSPGARRLARETGARLLGMPAPEGPAQDSDFSPDQVLWDGEEVATAAGPLKVLHTPGHASNHLCYLLVPQAMLFSGDHIMQGSTVVINPPDGDMKAYLDSLDRLLEEDIRFIAPGHGFLIDQAHAVVDFLTTHRMARERKVVHALKAHGPASLEDLTPHAYDDVPSAIHGVASRSLLAHLIKLEGDRRARQTDGLWQFIR
ncbi:MAG: MBL fold metallo-hydrolase [Marinobacter sp.]|nr:MBL fold metallo-hydrolase [Marinobacter sp.]